MSRLVFAVMSAVLVYALPARADDVLDARHAMEEAAITVDRLREETKQSGEMDQLLHEAKGVLIIPSFYKAAFFLGAAYGNGVLLVRQPDGTFGDPAFYRMTGGSLGLQFGMQSAAIVFVIRTEKGLSAVMNDEFKLGANAGIAIGTIGAGAEAATTTHVGNDIVAYSKNSGLFAGGALEGAAINPKESWNAAVYGVDNSDPRVIVQRSKLSQARNLKETLNMAAAAATAPAAQSSTTTTITGPGISAPASPGAVTSQPLSSPVQPESRQ
jgi:lipid-binding SYLF domain-containing protein